MTKVRCVNFRVRLSPGESFERTIEYLQSQRWKKEFREVGGGAPQRKIIDVGIKINLGLWYNYLMEFNELPNGTLVRVDISLKGGWGANWGFAIHILRELTKCMGPRQNLHYYKENNWSQEDEEIDPVLDKLYQQPSLTTTPSPASTTSSSQEKEVAPFEDLFAEFLKNTHAETLPSILGLMLDSLGENLTIKNPLHPDLWEIDAEANRLKINRSPSLTKVELEELEKKVYKWRASNARKVTFESSDARPEDIPVSPPQAGSQSVEPPLPVEDDLFIDLLAKARAGTPASELATKLDAVRRKILSVNPTSPTLLDITLEGGRLKSWGSKILVGDELSDFEVKMKKWNAECDQLEQK